MRKNISLIVVTAILLLGTPVQAESERVGRALDIKRQIDGWDVGYGPKEALFSQYKSFQKSLAELGKKRSHKREVLADYRKKLDAAYFEVNQLTGKIDKLEKEAGFMDIRTHMLISEYKKDKVKTEQKIDELEAQRKPVLEEEGRISGQYETTQSSLANIEAQISAKYWSFEKFIKSYESEKKVVDGLVEFLDRELKAMTPKERDEYDMGVIAAERVPRKTAVAKEQSPDTESTQPVLPTTPDQDAAVAAATTQPVAQPAVQQAAQPAGESFQLIDFNCGTIKVPCQNNRAVCVSLRDENSASVTILQGGKVKEINGREATRILIENGYFEYDEGVGFVATVKYLAKFPEPEVPVAGQRSPQDECGSMYDKELAKWNECQKKYGVNLSALDPDPKDYAKTKKNYWNRIRCNSSRNYIEDCQRKAKTKASEQPTRSWRDDLHEYKMSDQDAQVYGGGLMPDKNNK